MASFREIKTDPEFVVDEARPVEVLNNICSVQSCMYCHTSTSRENMMIKVDLDEERIQAWANSLGVKLFFSFNTPNWMCKSHFKSTDFTRKGTLCATAVPFRTEQSMLVIKNQTTEVSKTPFQLPRNPVRRCVFCWLKKPFPDITLIRGDSVKLAEWKQRNGISLNEAPIICKSHFKSDDFTIGGDLKYNAVLKLNKKSVNSNGAESTSEYVTCVYCKLRKHPSTLIKVPKNEEQVLSWKHPSGVVIDNNEIAKNPWVCKSHFGPGDIGRTGVLNPFATPIDIPPERQFIKCEYCHSTKSVLFLVHVNLDKDRLTLWNSIGIWFNNFDAVWMCKNHFRSWDFTKEGKELKQDAIPMRNRPADVRTCVYCKTTKSSSEFSKIVMDQKRFEVWKQTSGFDLNYADVVKNNWMCKSHFQFQTRKVEKTKPVPIENVPAVADVKTCVYCKSTQSFSELDLIVTNRNDFDVWNEANGFNLNYNEVVENNWICKSHLNTSNEKRFGVCVWCKSKQNHEDLASVCISLKNVMFWKRQDGTNVEFRDLSENPFVCKSHFSPDYITKKGTLRLGSVPNDSLYFSSIHLPKKNEKTCVYCGAKEDRVALAKILMNRTSFGLWTETVGKHIEYYKIVENPWICEEHLNFLQLSKAKVYVAKGVKKDDQGELSDSVVLCMYCKLYKKCSDMIVVYMNENRLEKWRNIVDLESSEGSPFVCRSHFKSDDFTPNGSLKKNAIPLPIGNVKLEEPELMDQDDDQQVDDLLDAAIQIPPGEEEINEEKPIRSVFYIPELQDHNYAKLDFDI